MTKDKALHAWFLQFLTAYPASSVPDDAVFPWLTYELITGAWDSGEISDAIGLGGVFVPCDDGAIWIKRGSPWCQNVRDDSDANIKRRYLNITVEYITAN